MAYTKLLDYIESYWPYLTVEANQHADGHLKLPNEYIAPSAELVNGFVFHEQFYWDTYFTLLGFDDTADHELILGMVENLFFMFDLLGYIPNSSNIAWHALEFCSL